MEDVANNNLEETLTQEQPTDVVSPEIQQERLAQAMPQNDHAANMARMREAKEKAERERAELQAQLEAYRNQKQEQPSYGDEDFVEGKHLKKEIDTVKRQIEAYKQQQMELTDESRLRQTYNDFDSVVNPENIQKLKQLDPEVAETIATSQASLYARGSTAYKRIKELLMPVPDNYAKDREKAQQNASKPRASNSVSPQHGDSPLGMANAFADGLTDDVKRQLWKDMQDAISRN